MVHPVLPSRRCSLDDHPRRRLQAATARRLAAQVVIRGGWCGSDFNVVNATMQRRSKQ